ncbi:MAG: alanine:cation symporter family protein [Myxococcales bacterium]|nr:alanine:cation symporter family protein [Myxococcales bacterium]
MDDFLIRFNEVLSAINGVIFHDFVLYTVLGVGVLFTIWSGFCQYHALSHGVAVIRGRYDDHDDPGAINHFQALSAALSATVGLGNIGGVAVAIALGGPGAIFWMWVVGVFGMALKTTEVTQSMLFRNTKKADDPHGGPMWVVEEGLAQRNPRWRPIGRVIGVLFCITLLIATITGGNMFQAWNVAVVTEDGLGIPQPLVGAIQAVLVGAVILGGIKRIGAVAGRIVPIMCLIYLIASFYVLGVHIGELPEMLRLIVASAFNPAEASGAFVGASFGLAFLWGMKRALFSSEVGQGSSPIAHSAAKTNEPVREGVVAGLEPFIDTIVVATLTSLVILSSGAWNREGETTFDSAPTFVAASQATDESEPNWTLSTRDLPRKTRKAESISGPWKEGDPVFVIARYGDVDEQTGTDLQRVTGTVVPAGEDPETWAVDWAPVNAATAPVLESPDIYRDYVGAALTSHAFDRVTPGLGKWLVLFSSWLFALSTMISWSYYGEQGVIYIAGERWVIPYKVFYCAAIVLATVGLVTTDAELDNLTTLGTGVMLVVNIPIMLLFGAAAMKAYRRYFERLKAGEFDKHKAATLTDLVEGRDPEDES